MVYKYKNSTLLSKTNLPLSINFYQQLWHIALPLSTAGHLIAVRLGETRKVRTP